MGEKRGSPKIHFVPYVRLHFAQKSYVAHPDCDAPKWILEFCPVACHNDSHAGSRPVGNRLGASAVRNHNNGERQGYVKVERRGIDIPISSSR